VTTGYSSLEFSDTFLNSFASRDFSAKERRAFLKALELLDSDATHPSLRVHQLHGDQSGAWSASASRSLRITFVRLPDGRKALLTCSRHYDR
jgi:hypothetical protein